MEYKTPSRCRYIRGPAGIPSPKINPLPSSERFLKKAFSQSETPIR